MQNRVEMRIVGIFLPFGFWQIAKSDGGIRYKRSLMIRVMMRANGRRIFSFLFTGRHVNLGGKGIDYCGEHLRDLQTHRKSQSPHFSLVPRAG